MKKETLISILEFSKMFFGVGIFFSYILMDHHRMAFILGSLILWIVSKIIYNKVK